jgi:phospholipase C
VPALAISPWIPPGSVTSTVFDHTSIIKTILLRFCRGADGKIPNMGARVNHAEHLGPLLSLDRARAPEPVSAYQHLIDAIAAWRAEIVRERLELEAVAVPRPDDLHDLQQEVVAAKRRLRAEGLPEGQP